MNITELSGKKLSAGQIKQISEIDAEIFAKNQWGLESFTENAVNEYDFLIAAVLPEQERKQGSGAESQDTEVLGYGLLRCFDDAELIRIAVRKSGRRKGIGRRLLGSMINEAKRRELQNIFLEVRSSNTAAIELYTHAGFTAEGIRRGYYSEPREDAVIMRYTC